MFYSLCNYSVLVDTAGCRVTTLIYLILKLAILVGDMY